MRVRDSIRPQLGAGLFGHFGQYGRQLVRVGGVRQPRKGPRRFCPHPRGCIAKRTEHTGRDRRNRGPAAHQSRHCVQVQRPRSAKAHQRKVAWVIALLYRDHPQRAEHVLVDDVDNAARCRHQVDVHRIGNFLYRALRSLAVEFECAAKQRLRQVTQHNIGVGYRRLLAAFSVSHRPRHSAGRLRPNAQCSG